jgi:hypothetical protein
MKKLIFAAAVLLAGLRAAQAQDLIVTDKGDTLNCKITKIRSDFVHFTFKYENEIRNTLLPVGQIAVYKTDYFSKPEVPIDKVKNGGGNYQKLRIGADGGWSYMTAKVSSSVPADFRDYIGELKSGYHFGGDASYFTSESVGFGLRYSLFRTSNEIDNITAIDPVSGQTRTGRLKDDVTIHFIGPTVCTRMSSANKKANFGSDLSLGYLAYKNNATVIDDFTLKSAAMGFMWKVNVDFALDKDLALELAFAYTAGTLNHYEFDYGNQTTTVKLDKDNLENISRIDLSVGIRWNK